MIVMIVVIFRLIVVIFVLVFPRLEGNFVGLTLCPTEAQTVPRP